MGIPLEGFCRRSAATRGGLVIKRRKEESIELGPDITIKVIGIQGGRVVLWIKAPRELGIVRTELLRLSQRLLEQKAESPLPEA